MNDERRAKIIMPQDVSFLSAIKHKIALQTRRQELVEKILNPEQTDTKDKKGETDGGK